RYESKRFSIILRILSPLTALFSPQTALFSPQTALFSPPTSLFSPPTSLFSPPTSLFSPPTSLFSLLIVSDRLFSPLTHLEDVLSTAHYADKLSFSIICLSKFLRKCSTFAILSINPVSEF